MDDRFHRPGGPGLASPPGDVLDEAAGALRAGRPAGASLAVGPRPDLAEAHNDRARALRSRGRLDEAAGHLRRAVELEPDHATWRSHLALVLLTLGRATEAMPHCEEAVRLAPDVAAFRDHLGTALRSTGRLDEARASYLDAIRLDPGLASAHANLGLIFLQEDRADEAWRLLARAAELEPGCAVYWEYLARLYEWVRRFDAAVPCWERVLALTEVGRGRLHLALGGALREEDRPVEAEAHYREAARIEPDSAEARVGLGALLVDRGEFAEAEAAFRAAIGLRPTHAPSHAGLASLLGGGLPDADLDALVGRIGDPGTGEEPRARLLFALGQVLDARGDHPRAAGCLREANALSLALARGGRRFQPAEFERSVELLIGAFGPGFFASAAGAGLDTRLPIFIVGLPRSGTTLLEQVLSSHPRVHGAGELMLGRRLLESLSAALAPSASPAECASLLDPSTIRLLSEVYLDELRPLAGDRADFVVDKMLGNFLILGLLAALFPGASFIHCRRDLRDVALSCWMADFDAVHWANDPGHIAAYLRAYLRAMDHWRATLPSAIHEVRYEELVSDLEGVTRRLLSSLGLDWDPACLAFHRTSRPVRTASRTQVRQPLHNRSVARWRRYEHELADLFSALPAEAGSR
jgi:tetratricopeptide (TPR) repeat protein